MNPITGEEMPDRQINALPVARLDFEDVRALKAAVSSDEASPILNHVLLREGFAEATNGHVLCRVPLKDDTGEPFSLPLEVRENRWLVHRAALGHVRPGHFLEIDMATGECSVVGKEGEEGYPIELPDAEVEIEGRRFPATDALLPRPGEEYRTLQLGHAILKALTEFAGAGGRLHLLVPPEGAQGYVARALPFQRPYGGEVSRSGVVMPMRVMQAFESVGPDAEDAKQRDQPMIPALTDDEPWDDEE